MKKVSEPISESDKTKMKNMADGILAKLGHKKASPVTEATRDDAKKDFLSTVSSVQNNAQISFDHALF